MWLPRFTLVRLKKSSVRQAGVPVTIKKGNARCGFTTGPSPCVRFTSSPIESGKKERRKNKNLTRMIACWSGSVNSHARGG